MRSGESLASITASVRGDRMANIKNLKPFTSDQSREEAVKNGRKGGIASGEARREKANLKKMLLVFLEEEAVKDKNGEPLTGAELMVKVAVREMTKGSPRFWELIRDTAGFKPIEKVQVSEIDQSVIDEIEGIVLEAEEEPADFFGHI